MDNGRPSLAPPPAREGWLAGTPEGRAALEAAEALANRIRARGGEVSAQVLPLLLRAEGFLVASRSSALAGHWRATVTFGRIAEEELRVILHDMARFPDSPSRIRRHPPNGVSVIRMPPDGPL